ncbi:hypothetical protein GCM10007386_45990 [Pseudoduganella dura]|nr:hypothetical protein GCM10007386_45990 [Pseudoduganella dura]
MAPLVELPTVPRGDVTPGVPMEPVAGATVPLTGAGATRIAGFVTRFTPPAPVFTPLLMPVLTPVFTWPAPAGAAGVVTVWAWTADVPSRAARINAEFIFMALSFVL